MTLSSTAAKDIARDLSAALGGSADRELTLSYAQSFVGSKIKAKGLVVTPETVKTVLDTGVKRGWFRFYQARVVPVTPVPPVVETKTAPTMKPAKLRTLMQMYWDDETLNERCPLSASSRPSLDTAISRVSLYAGDYLLTGTKSKKAVRRDIENLLEKYLPAHERTTTSNYAGQIVHHLLGLAEQDGLVQFAA